jgi:hypothetical protein
MPVTMPFLLFWSLILLSAPIAIVILPLVCSCGNDASQETAGLTAKITGSQTPHCFIRSYAQNSQGFVKFFPVGSDFVDFLGLSPLALTATSSSASIGTSTRALAPASAEFAA